MSKKLVLVDGMAMVYRAYFALIGRPLINSEGKTTSAVYGFVNSLVKVLDDEKPEYVAVCFDTAEPTFRHEQFPEYKAQRMEIPTDMPWQIEKVKEVIKAFNIPMIEMHGFEADDIIGTLAKKAEEKGITTYMVTPDKDFMQLITDKILMLKPARSQSGGVVKDIEVIDEKGVQNKFGVPPWQVIEVLGLMGDSSDNIPGIKGVGEKTAIALIQEYGTIEDMYKNVDAISKPKLKEKIINDKEMAFLSKKLVTIKTDVPIKIKPEDLKREEPDAEELGRLFTELEFKTMIKRFMPGGASPKPEKGEAKPKKTAKPKEEKQLALPEIKVEIPEHHERIRTIKDIKHEYRTITKEEDLKKLVEKLSKEPMVVFDTETDDIDPMVGNLVGIAFSIEENEGYYICLHGKHKDYVSESMFAEEEKERQEQKEGIEINRAIEVVKPLLENKKIKFIGMDMKNDYLVMKNLGIEMSNIYFDTLIGAFILRPEGSHDTTSLAEKYLSYQPINIKEHLGSGKNQITFDKLDIQVCSDYAAEDADITLQLYHRLKYELEKTNLLKVCNEVDFPLIQVLADMEFEGIKVDQRILAAIDKELIKLIDEYEKKIYKLAGMKFNINSTKQLAEILFEKLKLKPIRKTKTGFSTDVKVLEELRYQHEIAEVIVDYRTLTKLKSTYIEGLSKAINQRTGRVHTSYSQAIAATGRLSSINPNLQNIPIRSEAGRSIRKAFVPRDKTYKILSADYSQIELRIMAHYANDKNMISAFKRNHDIHTETSMRVFKVPRDQVTPNMRRKAKEVNFGIIYGIGAFGLASRLDIKNSEAKDIIDRYFNEYPSVRDYMDRTKKFARENGYVESLMGRRRYLMQINNQNASARAEDERAAINMPIQGTAADMIKIAMINIAKEMKKKKMQSKMLLQVHDELVFEAKIDEMDELKKIVTDKMKNAIKLNVPLEIEMGVGDTWFEAH
ncbi:MAG: DNA polymerase I [Ignavibacteriae bacterium]|nr:DNA polymerase I [Ignavibacteriota bacterium]MCB9242679.1 DNA polymerase I [Ignavibacteriales bacterium]